MADPEAPAKNYQITELTTAITNIAKTTERIETKMDGLVTKEKLDDEIGKVHVEYSPLKKGYSRLMWIAISTVVPIFIVFILQLVSNTSVSSAVHNAINSQN